MIKIFIMLFLGRIKKEKKSIEQDEVKLLSRLFYILKDVSRHILFFAKIHNVTFSKVMFVFIVLSFQSSFAQDYTIKKIDSIIFQPRDHKKFTLSHNLEVNNKVIQESKRLNYSKGIAYANYDIAVANYLSGNYSQTFKYIEAAEKENFSETDASFKVKLYDLQGCVYAGLGFYELAKTAFRKEQQEAKKIESYKDKSITNSRVYGQMGYLLSLQKNDSSRYYAKKAFFALNGVNEKDAIPNLRSLYPNLITCYTEEKKPDSVKYIVGKALGFLSRNKTDNYSKYAIYYYIGNDAYNRKQYQEALAYYLKAKSAIDKTDYHELRKNLYKNIADLYKEMDSTKKQNEYLTEYINANDKINKDQKISSEAVVKKIIKKTNNDLNETKSKLYLIITVIILTVIIFLLIALRFHIKVKKQKEKEIIIKEEIIVQKQKETDDLSQKVNDSFNEVIDLAKSNSPNFLVRFQEVYPDFCEKIQEIHPNIQNTELIFCAYLRLGFSTKDIANYTFVEPRTVEMRRYRLRKRFNIPPEKDLYIWMKSLG